MMIVGELSINARSNNDMEGSIRWYQPLQEGRIELN
jgi:hypothetical protein